jgi:lysophospholipase L1-like esterase
VLFRSALPGAEGRAALLRRRPSGSSALPPGIPKSACSGFGFAVYSGPMHFSARGSRRFSTALFTALAFATLADAQTTNLPAPPKPEAQTQTPSMAFPGHDALPGKGPKVGWDGYVPLWEKSRAEFWQHRNSDRGAVVFLGDSITQGWGTLAKDFPGLKVANRGIGGDTTQGVRYRLQEDVLDLHPKAVVLLIGINDLGNNGSPEDAAENIRAILAALQSFNPKMPVVVCKVMPSRAALAGRIQDLNRRVDQIVKGCPQCVRCDTWSIFATADGTCEKSEFPDMLHPNEKGYAKWAAAMKPILAEMK